MKRQPIISAVCAAAVAFSAATAFPTSTYAEGTDEKPIVESVIFEGGETVSGANQFMTVYASGNFDPSSFKAGGHFEVTYKGVDNAVYLALAEWDTSKWATVEADSCEKKGESYISTFSFDACAKSYGSTDLSDMDALNVCTGGHATDDTVIEKISWFGYPTEIDMHETTMLFKGSETKSQNNACLTFFYTKHVGGDWDASQINEGSYFIVEYTGKKDGILLAFTSASGATGWVAVYPDKTEEKDDGRYWSYYSYDNFSEKFGTNFARLDQLQAYTTSDEKVTLKRIAYFEGTGEPVDTSTGTWDRPDTGIAFIGDSIVQNPLVDTGHLNNIDWNGILDRTDCVNYGIGGQTTKECSRRIDEVASKNYDTAVILCGINDIGRGHTDEEIAANDKIMIDALKAKNEDIGIFIISVLPTTPVYYTDSQDRIRGLNERLKALAEAEGATFIDCHSAFLREDGQYCKEELVFDGLHPNLDGYAVIAGIVNPYLKEKESENPEPPASDNSAPVVVPLPSGESQPSQTISETTASTSAVIPANTDNTNVDVGDTNNNIEFVPNEKTENAGNVGNNTDDKENVNNLNTGVVLFAAPAAFFGIIAIASKKYRK